MLSEDEVTILKNSCRSADVSDAVRVKLCKENIKKTGYKWTKEHSSFVSSYVFEERVPLSLSKSNNPMDDL